MWDAFDWIRNWVFSFRIEIGETPKKYYPCGDDGEAEIQRNDIFIRKKNGLTRHDKNVQNDFFPFINFFQLFIHKISKLICTFVRVRLRHPLFLSDTEPWVLDNDYDLWIMANESTKKLFFLLYTFLKMLFIFYNFWLDYLDWKNTQRMKELSTNV